MKLASIAYGLIGVALLAGALEWHGHHRGYNDGVAATTADADKKIKSAQEDQRLAEAQRDASNLTLTNLRSELKTMKDGLEAQRAISQAALDARDRLQNRLDKLIAQRTAEATKAAHEDPQCADLARLPICPAVAERLWGKAAGHPAGPSH